MKTCICCNETKAVSEFYKRADSKSGYRNTCCRCMRTYHRVWDSLNKEKNKRVKSAWVAENREHIRVVKLNATYQRRFGIGYGDFLALAERQGNKCAICSVDLTFHKGKTGRSAVLDHCHDGGGIRGILCSNCNLGLGLLGDDLPHLAAAVTYLKKAPHPALKFVNC